MESGEIKREESAPLLCVGGQDEVNDQVWREFREAGISATFVRGMVDLGLVDAGYAAPTIGAILSDKKLISSTVAVLPFQSGRIVVIGRAINHWLAWQTAEDLQLVPELSDGVEISQNWSLKIGHPRALRAYLEAVNRSRDNLRPIADFTRLACGFLCALGYRQSLARAA
ncbi:MAG: hypothetical protein A2663_04820 [Candidatus Buchananbacteria bacterium RIFCSPHIGHO2_01_FULL_46_12]|uniref:Uncharacterized protein n=1 Tax=Candidatus Buchananbacteria bacterium RIFCSPHIGHO2_01_FULL_46_12 TaxID=1797536 RepID=A0A1G1YC58_9BACT|nr:MAG: hypothetical protein A2663_04820 [Candidatus Buchananbacteria bacterium RIFCSPHIGHO2_01_FULL_46_12]